MGWNFQSRVPSNPIAVVGPYSIRVVPVSISICIDPVSPIPRHGVRSIVHRPIGVGI